jgi:hypothetical protein
MVKVKEMLVETTREVESTRPGFDFKELDNDLIVCGKLYGHFGRCSVFESGFALSRQ